MQLVIRNLILYIENLLSVNVSKILPTAIFRKAAQSLVRPWALILRGRLYGANISVEYYSYLFPYTVRPTLYRV